MFLFAAGNEDFGGKPNILGKSSYGTSAGL